MSPSALPAQFHDQLAMEFTPPEFGATYGEVRMPIAAGVLGYTGHLHGGAIATLFDFTCAMVAAQCISLDPAAESLVTSDMHVRYLATARGDGVVAKASVVRAGSSVVVVAGELVDDEDRVVASADMAFMRVPNRQASPAAAGSVPS